MIEVDSLGKRCPAPIIDLARALKDIEVGDQIRLKSDDPATWIDLSAWARMTGNIVEQVEPFSFVITKK